MMSMKFEKFGIIPRQLTRWMPLVALLTALTHETAGASRQKPGEFPSDPLAWPAIRNTQRPWTRWWWFGSAVDKPGITRELEGFARAGIGGVEICPIYGAIGAEDRFIPFLSPQWMEMLAHTTTEAARLGLGVDLTTGTGWPFGGTQVDESTSSKGLTLVHHRAGAGKTVRAKLPAGRIESLHAFSNDRRIDLMARVSDGKLEWTAPAEGSWEVLGLVSTASIQKVKRAAPGAEGPVLDPFSTTAMDDYLKPFDRAFADFRAPMPRAQFHDSFEYYGAAWTPGFLDAFRSARGYDLADQLPAFAGIGNADDVARVRSDYRETLGDLHLGYLRRWRAWSEMHGCATRNQSHGSPGNLLDHYAAATIPETEIFRNVDDRQIPMMHLAASAARSKGGNLVSAETFTWLDEHFRVTPAKIKEAADFVFLAGVNHVLFHGIPSSPADAPWPGWLFYASTHMGPTGGLWRDLPTFNGYLARCQTILQHGTADTEVLVFYPYHDLLATGEAKLPLFTIHNQDQWLWPTRFHESCMELWRQGIPWDAAGENQLAGATVEGGCIVLGGHRYRALVLPGAKHITPEGMERIATLASQGANVISSGSWPADVPGHHEVASRRQRVVDAVAAARRSATARDSRGDLVQTLAGCGIRAESMTRDGLAFVRRRHAEGYHYFIVNRSAKPFSGTISPARRFANAVWLDPWRADPATPAVVAAPASGDDLTTLHLDLAPGESRVLRTFDSRTPGSHPETQPRLTETPPARTVALTNPWSLTFIEGGPTLPKPVASTTPGSWTKLTVDGVDEFSGTARYTTRFHLDTLPASCRLDLGEVAHTARVIVNGQPAGTSWCPPHRVDIGPLLATGDNRLEVEVSNLAANRIAGLDRRKVAWKRFHEINFVNIDYKPFDASPWPAMDSGLIGPVTLSIRDKK